MQFLTPWTALVAAAVAVPLLLLLYFLKLKRRELIVSSTLLWKRAVQDLQVNAPFQRLRNNILLFLQLLMLLALLLGLAGPILSLTSGQARRHVLLIDRSASMSATDVEPSRLEEAKRQARIYVESLRDQGFLSFRGARDQTMVIAFDKHSKLMCNFTADKRQLIAAIDSIQAGDGDSFLGEAIMVAQAFTQPPGDEPANQGAQEPAKLMLFSDGRIADLDQIIVNTDELTFHCIGESRRNVGVTAMRARRSYENPDEVEVFASMLDDISQGVYAPTIIFETHPDRYGPDHDMGANLRRLFALGYCVPLVSSSTESDSDRLVQLGYKPGQRIATDATYRTLFSDIGADDAIELICRSSALRTVVLARQ